MPAALCDARRLGVFKAHAPSPARGPSVSSSPVAASGPLADHGLTGFLLFPQTQQWNLQGTLGLKPESDLCFSNWVPRSSGVLQMSLGSAQGAEGGNSGRKGLSP